MLLAAAFSNHSTQQRSAVQAVQYHWSCTMSILMASPAVAVQGKVLLAAAVSGHSPAANLLCRLYSDSKQAGAAAMDPDLLGAAYQAAVAQLEGCSTGDSSSSSSSDSAI